MLWSQVEVSALIVCASIPSLRPLIRSFPQVSKAMGLLSPRKSRHDSATSSNIGGRSPLAHFVPARTRIRAAEVHTQDLTSPQMSQDSDTRPESYSCRGTLNLPPLTDPQGHTEPTSIVVTRDVDVVLERSGGDWIVTSVTENDPGPDLEAAYHPETINRKESRGNSWKSET